MLSSNFRSTTAGKYSSKFSHIDGFSKLHHGSSYYYMSVRYHHLPPSESWRQYLPLNAARKEWDNWHRKNFEASEAKFYRWQQEGMGDIAWKTAGVVVSGVVAYCVDARIKERSEKLEMLDKIRNHVDDHRAKAQEVLSNLDFNKLEIVPRLGTYTHASEREIKDYSNINQDLLSHLKSNKFLLERLDGIESTVQELKEQRPDKLFKILFETETPLFMSEVNKQLKQLKGELNKQYKELEIAYYINSALMYLKLKQYDNAGKRIEQAEEAIEIQCKECKECAEIILREGLEKAVNKMADQAVGNSYLAQALTQTRIIQGKVWYGKALNDSKNANNDALKKSENYFQKVADLKLVFSAQTLAKCYKGYALSEQGMYNDAISILNQASEESPDLPNIHDALGWGLYMLSLQVSKDSSAAKPIDEQKLLKTHQTALRILNLLDPNPSHIKLKGCTIENLPKRLMELSLEKFNKAISLNPRSIPAMLAHRGWLLLEMSKHEKTGSKEQNDLLEKALKDLDCSITLGESDDYPLARAGRSIVSHLLKKEFQEDYDIASLYYAKFDSNKKDLPFSIKMVLDKFNDKEYKMSKRSDFILPTEKMCKSPYSTLLISTILHIPVTLPKPEESPPGSAASQDISSSHFSENQQSYKSPLQSNGSSQSPKTVNEQPSSVSQENTPTSPSISKPH